MAIEIRTPAAVPDLSHRLRRLGFFDLHFRDEVGRIALRYHLDIAIDSVRLTRAFLAWGESFTRQRRAGAVDRRDFVVFTAGLLLMNLLEAEPLSVTATGGLPLNNGLVAAWPDGFVCVQYCLEVMQAVLQQEFGARLAPTPAAADPAVWASFRENVHHDPATAVGYFDLFTGSEPNWWFPTVAAYRQAMRTAAHVPAAPVLR